MSLDGPPANQSSQLQASAPEPPARIPTDQSAFGTESDPLSGHLNHLSSSQSEALDSFKKECIERTLYRPAEGAKSASHSDATLLRFLRARRFDVNGALDQFAATEKWRKENQIELLYENIDIDSYETSRRVYPQWTGRRDRRGIPIYVYVIRDLNSKNMAEYTSKTSHTSISKTHASSNVPARLLRLFALYENMLEFVLPVCSRLDRPNPETPIVNTTNIVDISGVGLKQFWNLKGHMQDASTLATAHYPETLDRIFIIGAPAFFPTVWGWIKRWFDPVTTSKIFILPASEVKSTLSKFMDPANFPKQYGGELDWQWEDMPHLDEPAKALIGSLERIGSDGDLPETGQPTGEEAKQEERQKENVLEEGAAEKRRKSTFVRGPVVFRDGRMDIMGSHNGEARRRTIAVPDIEAAGTEMNGNTKHLPVDEDEKLELSSNGAAKESSRSPVASA
ncbi:hypothetical protein FQN57_007224 [Myotisia sp. PD_48]|nr:hypothetical protein FQN57_007224 [Myotisia sp. PD_48]